MSNHITTFTGKHFDPMNPDPSAILVEDIAHALSLLCRGNGHVKTFWSVGEHCILCAKEAAARGLPGRMVLACLLHDASECYLSDVPRPIKQNLPQYSVTEDRILDLVYEKFLGSVLTEEEQKLLKQIDDDMLWFDMDTLIEKQPGEMPEVQIRPDYTVRPFEAVEREYLELFYRYYSLSLFS